MASLHLQPLHGNWSTGIALDFHTVRSTQTGLDEHGRPKFDTQRTQLGELLYGLKYRGDAGAAQAIVATAAGFLAARNTDIEVVVPVPPSKQRALQPVPFLAAGIARALGLAYEPCVSRTRDTPEQKGIIDPVQRQAALAGLFRADLQRVSGKSVLLFDDLYRSGATLRAVTELLLASGGASRVRVLTITKTRTNA